MSRAFLGSVAGVGVAVVGGSVVGSMGVGGVVVIAIGRPRFVLGWGFGFVRL
jgi:hypothetical protein